MARESSGGARGRKARPRDSGTGPGRSSAADRRLDRWLGSPWMALPVLGLALAVRLIHLDQLALATTSAQPSAPERLFLAGFGLDRFDPADLRLAGVFVSALTAVLVQRLGQALVGPATGLYAGLWMAFWWPAVALAPLLVPATATTLFVALALLGLVAAAGAKRPYGALAAGLGTGGALTLDAASLILVPAGWLVFALHRKWKRTAKLLALALFLTGVGIVLVGLNGLSGRGGPVLSIGPPREAVAPVPPDSAVRTPEEMAEDPWGALLGLGGRAARLLAWPEPAGAVDIAPLRVRSWALRLPCPAWELALPLGLLGVLLALRHRKELPGARVLALVTLAGLVLMLRAPVTAESRLPLAVALVPLALFAVGRAWSAWRRGGLRLPGRRKTTPKR